MASDRLVTSQVILKSLMALKRQGRDRVLQDLEKTEPELAEFTMETLGQIYQRIGDLGATHKQTQILHREIESLVLVAVTALWQSHYELWKEQSAGSPLDQLDPAYPGDSPAAPSAGDSPGPSSATPEAP